MSQYTIKLRNYPMIGDVFTIGYWDDLNSAYLHAASYNLGKVKAQYEYYVEEVHCNTEVRVNK